MSTTLEISETVINRLLQIEEPVTVRLYGVFYKKTLTIIGLQSGCHQEADLVHSFPAEIDFCGVADVAEPQENKQRILKCLSGVDVTDNPVFISYQQTENPEDISAHVIINGSIEPADYIVVSEKQLRYEFTQIRVQAELPFSSELSKDSIKNAFTALRTSISTGRMVFHFPKNDVYLLGNSDTENSLTNKSGDPTLLDLSSSSDELVEGSGKKKKSRLCDIEVLPVNMLQRVTTDGSSNNSKNHGLLCILDKKHSKTVNVIIPVDALAMLSKKRKVVKLYEILVETVNRNLRLYEKTLLEQLHSHVENPSTMSQLEMFHFYPDCCGHFVTRVYPRVEDERSEYAAREYLHKQFMLPLTRPLFRKSNKHIFGCNKSGEPLFNPHEGLKPTDNGGEVALVNGKYSYYHYCQDNMDDNGWGCAYRSLQTLASWYILQGYSDKTVPTYKDIQKCLVDIGDKPSNFIGSKQWIGSTEVSFVLNTLLGVTSKIMYVSSGEEMAYKGAELLNHFQMHGSPIMIGGGVLAHTILGVDYNKQSGDIRFLILDPHYTGSEEIHTIQSKGWCGWKGINFWDKTAYYNMCMPQVLMTI